MMMKNRLRKTTALLLLAAATLIVHTHAHAQDHSGDRAADKHRVNLPPTVELAYAIRAKQSGFNVDGESHIRWSSADGKYQVSTDTRAMLVGKILDAKSEGAVDEYGLAPQMFYEKRFRRDATTTTFNRDSKTISFSASGETYPIKGGEQDRNSAIWQLIALARSAPAKIRPDSEWTFFVAGQRDAEPWTFHVVKQEKISTPQGELDCWRILKAPPPDQKGQQVEIWLAPGQEWYPARIRYTEPDGDYIEQNLASVTKKPAAP
jgi:hypothetical protein